MVEDEQKNIPANESDHSAFKRLAAERKMSMKELFHVVVEKLMDKGEE